MLIYNYDEYTKEYLYSEEAYLDPLATKLNGVDTYFMPENATKLIPMEASAGYVTVFEDGCWSIKKDYRGRHQIDATGFISVIDYIGDVHDGFVLLTEEQYQKLLEDPMYYVVQNNMLIVNPKLPEIEAEKLAKTYMTKWDFVKYILNPLGFTFAMLKDILSKDIVLEEAWACCSYVYRGDQVLCANIQKLLPDATPEYLDNAFKTYGTYGG